MPDGLRNLLAFSTAFAAIALVRFFVAREGLAAFGLRVDARAWRLLARGALVGLVLAAVEPALLVVTGQGSLAWTGGDLAATAGFVALTALGMAAVGLQEEALFRGWILPAARARWGVLAGVAVSSAAFGLIHVIHYDAPRAGLIAALSNALFGAAVALRVLRQRTVMWAIGCHAAWNVVEASLRVPGTHAAALFDWRVRASVWSGPPGLPEGGLVDLAMSLVLLAWCAWQARIEPAGGGRPSRGRGAGRSAQRWRSASE